MDEEQEKLELRRCLAPWLRERGLPLNRPFRCLNPAHADEHPSMRYFSRAEMVHCFACGANYDVFDLVGMERGLPSFAQQLQAVKERFLPEKTEKKEKGAGKEPSEERGESAEELPDWGPGEGLADAYFRSRGLSDRTAERFGLRMQDGEAVLPIWRDGACVGVCCRRPKARGNARYRNGAGEMDVWNGDALAGEKPVFVTEGIFDALSLEECGFSAVALCGVGRVGRLASLWQAGRRPRLIAAGDADPAGRALNCRLAETFAKAPWPLAELVLPQGCKDANEALLYDRLALAAACEAALPETENPADAPLKEASADEFSGVFAQSDGEDDDGLGADFRAYLRARRGRAAFSTGIDCVDALLQGGLHPGLTVLGAASGMGKTTFLLQLADAFAAAGETVLFCTVEMNRCELLAKSLARLDGRLTARALLDGKIEEAEVDRLLTARTRALGGRVRFLEAEETLTPSDVEKAAQSLAGRLGKAPVVIVDYLQLLAPERDAATDKQVTDRAVQVLKRLARRLDAAVLTASSFNREAYYAGAAMNAFKESGLVEYSADVLLALQYAGTGKKDFDPSQAAAAPARSLELLVLKNRFGAAGTRAFLRYRPAAECFSPGESAPARHVLH